MILGFLLLLWARLYLVSSASSLRPNIIFILTDDQDLALGGLNPMVKTTKYFTEHGCTFTNAFTTVPLCCPSRASILSGKYQHNHRVVNNSESGNCYGEEWRLNQEQNAFPVYLQSFNYTTFFAGKYMNQYGLIDSKEANPYVVPPGWDHWNALIGNSRYYNYSLSVNGRVETHGSHPDDYLPDLINARAAEFLKSHDISSGSFFMMLSTPACHSPFTPSQKYSNRFTNVTAPRTPNFARNGGPDKHWLVRQAPDVLPDSVVQDIDDIYGKRWATLLSVDDMVENIITILQDRGLIDNTFIFFTSDNGFHFGQFSLPWDKRHLYEFDIRIPLLAAGPGISPGLVIEVNFALELAGLKVPSEMDGASLVPLFSGREPEEKWRSFFLIEYSGEGHDGPFSGCPQYSGGGLTNCFPDCICQDASNNSYTCIRSLTPTDNFIYCSFLDSESFVEMYDLNMDPYQMRNLARRSLSKAKREELDQMIYVHRHKRMYHMYHM